MSSVYFGDNVYGLRAAANHYFSRRPEDLTVEQAAMLAGLVKAPSSLAPTKNLKGARARGKIVEEAMVRAGFVDAATARKLPQVKLTRGAVKDVPTGTYFADWVLAKLGESEPRYGEQRIVTTLEDRLQRQAAQAIRAAAVGGAQVALVSMRPDGRVVAMVGGKSYKQSPFNRVTQAKRQSGSTFKLFVYLAALRAGYTPSDTIEDAPLRIGNWTPSNYEGKYRGIITLRDAFAHSSNVAAVRLSERVGRGRVIQAARDLGVTSDIEQGPTLALGTSAISLMEMTSAFASVANGAYPVRPRGLPEAEDDSAGTPFEGSVRRNMMELLWAVTHEGSGRGAALPIPTFGKTGTSQESRDAYFIGVAGDLVTAVWIGRDDNKPLGDVQGGGIPARIWRAFMAEAVKNAPAPAPADALAVPADEILAPAAGPMTAPTYDIGAYDVDDSPVPAQPIVGDDAAPLPPAEDEPAAEAPPPEEDTPPPAPRNIPTVTPPPPPPAPQDEPPPDEDDQTTR
jgi:penicillin-binding protein 1A